MRINQTHLDEMNEQRLNVSVFGRSDTMNIKLIRNAMFITIIILVISVVGKTSAHETNPLRVMFERGSITQVMFR
jgi:hypothetical protein